MTVALVYTEAIFRRAIFRYLWRAFARRLIVPAALLIIALGFVSQTNSPWLLAITVLPLVMVPSMFGLGYWLRIRESLNRFRRLDHGTISITVNDASVAVESAVGRSETKWKIYTEMWEFPDSFLLFYGSGQFITLPADQVPAEFIQFIRTKLESNFADSQSTSRM